MFKSILMVVALIALIGVSSEAQAQGTTSPTLTGWVELEGSSRADNQSAQVLTLMNIECGKIDTFIWAQSGPGFDQVYGGPAITVKPWLAVAVGAGVQRVGEKVSPRIGGSIWTGKNRVSNLLLWEAMGSGPWYKNQTSIRLPKGVTGSLIVQRFAGIGPEIQVAIPKTSFSVRASALRQGGVTTASVAVRFSF